MAERLKYSSGSKTVMDPRYLTNWRSREDSEDNKFVSRIFPSKSIKITLIHHLDNIQTRNNSVNNNPEHLFPQSKPLILIFYCCSTPNSAPWKTHVSSNRKTNTIEQVNKFWICWAYPIFTVLKQLNQFFTVKT